jgi:hypothetical protein
MVRRHVGQASFDGVGWTAVSVAAAGFGSALGAKGKHALRGYSQNLRPILRREPLGDGDRAGRVGPPMFGRIEVLQRT